MNTYILQKDLPQAKAGLEIHFDKATNFYSDGRAIHGETKYGNFMADRIVFEKDLVENTPEWFLPKEEIAEGMVLDRERANKLTKLIIIDFWEWLQDEKADKLAYESSDHIADTYLKKKGYLPKL